MTREDILHKVLLRMEKFNFKFADIVISTNESYKKFAIQRGRKKADEVFVVRNGPRLDKIVWMPPNDALKDGFKHLIVYVGAIDFQGRIDVLLKAAQYIIYEKKITLLDSSSVSNQTDLNKKFETLVDVFGTTKLTRNESKILIV